MEIKGDEFIKKVQIKQEREELEQRLTQLHEGQTSYDNIPNKPPVQMEESESSISDISLNNIPPEDEQELRNIKLNSGSTNENNKKKYLILGLILIILFLSTILIIRLLNDDTPNKTDDFVNTPTQTSNTNESNIDDEYKKILDNRVTRQTQEENSLKEEPLKVVEKEAIKFENVQDEVIKDEDLEQIISKIKEKEVKKNIEKKVVKKTPKKETKKIVKKEIKKEATVKKKRTVRELVSSSSPSGYFVQIGAFSKSPSNAYINKIRAANLKYKVYKTVVNGKTYNKVLIGPYSSRVQASKNINNIKNKLNLSSAYILKF